MSSINDKNIIDNIANNNGVYSGGDEADPPAYGIIEYQNVFNGKDTWAVAYSKEQFNHIWDTIVCLHKRVYWLKDGAETPI